MNDEELKKLLERIAVALEKQNVVMQQRQEKIDQAIDQITNMMGLAATTLAGIQGHES